MNDIEDAMMVRADNAEELALIAQEIGAEVIRGALGYYFHVSPARSER